MMKKLFNLMLAMVLAVVAVSCEDERVFYPPFGPDNGDGDEEPIPPSPDEEVDYTQIDLVGTDPAFVTSETMTPVKILFNAEGTALDPKSYKGEIYAHMGVITNLSKDSKDWKYTLSKWGENLATCKFTQNATYPNIFELTMPEGPRAYYNVPAAEEILSLAFVFRAGEPNAGTEDQFIEVKDNGNDIYIELSKGGLDVMITAPSNGAVWEMGQSYTIAARASSANSLKVYVNDQMVEESAGTMIEYTYTASTYEDLIIKAEASNGSDTVVKEVRACVLGATQSESRPAGVKEGVTVNGDEATFVLYAPNKQQVSLLADFNDFSVTNEHLMKHDGDYFWVTVSGLEANTEYAYQYLVDGTIKVGDPYSTKILDPWNDKWINQYTTIYPNLREYPSDKATDILSVFSTSTTPVYTWTVENFEGVNFNQLAVYELCLRDFTEERSIEAARQKIGYLKDLGINAIELMPVQEFDGNNSWGYNPCFYFAPDKAYGDEAAYKRFIDECHQQGIAVILDVVFNHATGQFPWAKMWWDGSATANENPFFNREAKHDFNVYHDFNHLYPKTRSYFKEVLQYWLTEYKLDGYRFDLTKGFVQNPSKKDAFSYSAERVEILTDYARAIREVKPDAYIIFEHFCDQSEEDKLFADVKALCWSNAAMNGYMESVMGWYDGAVDPGTANSYYCMGDFQNDNWQNGKLMEAEGNLYVAQDVIFADKNSEGCVFKIRKGTTWDVSYGVSNVNHKNSLGTAISLNGDQNIQVAATLGVKYDIYFDAKSNPMRVWVMPDGQKPSVSSAARPRATYKSSFSDFKQGRMNNIETHDEERIGYKAITYGQSWVKSDWSVISKHMQSVYAMHFLTPYPKMMWQFGELGYDYSINSNEDGTKVGEGDDYRTDPKPVRWDYFNDENRKAVYTTISKVLEFRNDHPEIYAVSDIPVRTWEVGDANMSAKTLVMDKVICVANFTNGASSKSITVPASGQWTNLLTGATVSLGSSHTVHLAGSEFIILVRE